MTLRKRTKEDRKTIEGLGKQVAMLERKVKDRDEELREKGRGFSVCSLSSFAYMGCEVAKDMLMGSRMFKMR